MIKLLKSGIQVGVVLWTLGSTRISLLEGSQVLCDGKSNESSFCSKNVIMVSGTNEIFIILLENLAGPLINLDKDVQSASTGTKTSTYKSIVRNNRKNLDIPEEHSRNYVRCTHCTLPLSRCIHSTTFIPL